MDLAEILKKRGERTDRTFSVVFSRYNNLLGNYQKLAALHKEASKNSIAKANSELEKQVEDLSLKNDLATITKKLDETLKEINDLKEANEEQTKTIEELTKKNTTFLEEINRLRPMLDEANQSIAKLTTENEQLVSRILDEKMQMIQQINEMNDLNNRLEKKLKAANSVRGRLSSTNSIELNLPHGKWHASTKNLISDVSLVPDTPPFRVSAHESEVADVTYSNDGVLLLSASSDKTVKVWDPVSFRLKSVLRGPTQPVITVAAYGHMCAGGSNDKEIHIWSTETGRATRQLRGHAGKIYSIEFSDDGRTLLSGSTDRSAKLWDLRTGKCTRSFAASSMCNATCFLDQHQIVTGHQDGILRVYDAGTGAEMTELRQSLGYSITGLSQTSVGRPVIAACCRSNVIQCLDTITMSPVDTLSTSDFRVASHWCKARFSSDGAHLIAPSGSGKIEVWKRDDKTFKHETSLECGSSAIMACDWHNLGLQVVGGDKMGSTHIFGHCGV
eukprot:TRINITY_DN4614_c0_g2_i2.p1 TRINITY_DN4614_c0_g2~~TRINITY_DN4614_c0_g2_i2.p1  ORF type:complete len:502 (-),score=173.85 TRINITY_DN4614_c0_g2_i2:173-1678(-)